MSDKYVRPTVDEYMMQVMDAVAARATCNRGRSGCVIAKDGNILSTGYVGSPKGLPHCDDVGHLMKSVTHEDGTTTEHCMRTVHAEQNALIYAARYGVAVDGATLYCRMTPCRTCAMLIINAGISRVVAQKHYQAGDESIEMFKATGVAFSLLDSSVQTYS